LHRNTTTSDDNYNELREEIRMTNPGNEEFTRSAIEESGRGQGEA